jgi:CRP-like cAMP-binding protein/HEAT repeat protein
MSFLGQLLNIRPAEWRRLLYFYVTLLLMVVGLTWAAAMLEATFLRQLGVGALPGFFIIKALAAVGGATLYAAFADRVPNRRLLLAILAVSLAAILVGAGLVQFSQARLGYPLLYLIIFVPLDDIFFAHWYIYVNDFYDTRAAKRVVPVLVTAVGVGGVIGGWTVPLISRLLAPLHVVYAWWGVLVVVTGLVWLMPRLFRDRAPAAVAAEVRYDLPAFAETLREGYHYVSRSTFLRWLAVSALTLFALLTLLQFYTSQILVANLPSVEQLSSFIGWLMGLTYLLLLPVQFFVLSRLIGRLGLGNSSLIYPAGNLAICTGLAVAPGLPTAALAYFSRTNFYGIVGYTLESLLYNAVPLRIKARARLLIGGIMVPLGALIGGGLLLLPWANSPGFLSIAIVALAVCLTGIALAVRSEYGRALIKMLEQEDFSFLMAHSAAAPSVADPATLGQLRKKLDDSRQNHELTIFVAKLICELAGPEAMPLLAPAVRAAAEPRTRAAILDVIFAADLRGEAVRQLYTDLLADPAGPVRQSALAGLVQLAPSAELRPLLSTMLADPDLEVRLQALAALAQTGALTLDPAEPGTQNLERLLAEADPPVRARGVHVLGLVNDPRALTRLLDYGADPADEVRLEAALGLEARPAARLAAEAPVAERVILLARALLHDPVERVRNTAVCILGSLAAIRPAVYDDVLVALVDSSLAVRSAAVEVLAGGGRAIVPRVHPKLEAPDPRLRKMAAVTLSRISPHEFGPLVVSTHITGNLIAVYRNVGLIHALAPGGTFPSLIVLRSALTEQNQWLLDEIFYLLGAVHPPASVQLIAQSLRGDTARARANAIEALEALITPQMAEELVPLFDADQTPEHLLEVGQAAWNMQPPTALQALRHITGSDNGLWLRALGLYVAGDLGATLAPPPAPAERPASREESTPGRRARRGAAGLLGALIEPSPAVPPPSDRPASGLPASGGPPVEPRSKPLVSLANLEALLTEREGSSEPTVRRAAQTARQRLTGANLPRTVPPVPGEAGLEKEAMMLANIEKVIFLKEVSFFGGMSVDQLRVLANVCEEELFSADTRIYAPGDPGGVLYVVVNGRVGIEQEKRAGSSARLATVEAHSYFGEMNLFDNSPRTTMAVALQDTLTLRLRREPLIALVRQHPDLSLALINVLSQRLRETSDRVAELTRTRPRELHKLFDQFDTNS